MRVENIYDPITTRFEMIYDEEKLKVLMDKDSFGKISELYHMLQEMYPLKLKILKKVKCHRCGFCCKSCNVMLSKQDIDTLCEYLQCSFEELYEKYMDKNARMPYLKLPCPFLNEDNECDVYPVRPKPCKEFPFNEFTVIVDPCPLGKDIRTIIEEIEGPITEINEDMQEIANMNNEIFDHMINRETHIDTENYIDTETHIDTGRHLRINIQIDLLKKMRVHIKHNKKKR
jgi:Fe-S-cluster containining protein